MAHHMRTVGSWPPELQEYLCARIRVISARTLQVCQVVRTPGLYKDSTATFLDPHSREPCTYQSWDAGTAPGLSRLHGHVFTRNMEDIAACMHAFDTGVLRQNMKSATVPPWRGFCQAPQESLRQLTNALPDTRVAAAGSLLQSLTAVCKAVYDSSYAQYPPLLHERYICAQLKKLPSGAVCDVFDKGVQVPNVACAHFWREFNRVTFLETERFEELWCFHSHEEARCIALWYLLDGASLTLHGAYTKFSAAMGCSPVRPDAAHVAMTMARTKGASRGLKAYISDFIHKGVEKLKLLAPMWVRPESHPFLAFPLLSRAEFRARARAQAQSEHDARRGAPRNAALAGPGHGCQGGGAQRQGESEPSLWLVGIFASAICRRDRQPRSTCRPYSNRSACRQSLWQWASLTCSLQ